MWQPGCCKEPVLRLLVHKLYTRRLYGNKNDGDCFLRRFYCLILIFVTVGDDLDWGSNEPVLKAKAIFHEAHVAEVEQFGIIDVEHKRGRVNTHL
jgi:hypothetical protein